MLWGDQKFSSSSARDGSDDDAHESALKKRKAGRNRQGKPATCVPTLDGAPEQEGCEASSSAGASVPGSGWALALPKSSAAGRSKKASQAHKELDKCESLVLQSKQLKTQMEDGRHVMQVTCKRINDLLEKLSSKLNDEATNFYLDLIRSEGAGCRAEGVWQQVKDP